MRNKSNDNSSNKSNNQQQQQTTTTQQHHQQHNDRGRRRSNKHRNPTRTVMNKNNCSHPLALSPRILYTPSTFPEYFALWTGGHSAGPYPSVSPPTCAPSFLRVFAQSSGRPILRAKLASLSQVPRSWLKNKTTRAEKRASASKSARERCTQD